MSSETMTANGFAGGMSESNVRGWVTFAGISLMILGTAAVIYDVTATTVSVALIGWLLMTAGVMQVVNAFYVRSWSGFFLFLLDGIIRATVGALIVLYPDAGAQSITLLLSFYFFVAGLFKTIASISLLFPGWGWSVASGLIAVALGVMLAMQWPASATWFIGFAVGIDLILDGWALLRFAGALTDLSTSYA
ncbi:MAG TPA: HdeD family acid-resistance protein [Vicinamibacterales bacterium]|nr:HdeD family acid-resistance protein [Vicinamibacterales bacterium]